MNDQDQTLRKTITESYAGLRFDERMKGAVRRRATDTRFRVQRRLERAGMIAAAAAVLAMGMSASILLVTTAQTTPPDYVITSLPAAGYAYEEAQK